MSSSDVQLQMLHFHGLNFRCIRHDHEILKSNLRNLHTANIFAYTVIIAVQALTHKVI